MRLFPALAAWDPVHQSTASSAISRTNDISTNGIFRQPKGRLHVLGLCKSTRYGMEKVGELLETIGPNRTLFSLGIRLPPGSASINEGGVIRASPLPREFCEFGGKEIFHAHLEAKVITKTEKEGSEKNLLSATMERQPSDSVAQAWKKCGVRSSDCQGPRQTTSWNRSRWRWAAHPEIQTHFLSQTSQQNSRSSVATFPL